MKQPTLSAKLTAPILLFKYFWGFSCAYAIASRLDTFPLSLPLIYFPFDKMIQEVGGSIQQFGYKYRTSFFSGLNPQRRIRISEKGKKAEVTAADVRILSEINKLENIYLR